MLEFLQTLNPLVFFLMFVAFLALCVGIGGLGGFVNSRLQAKDKLKIEQMKHEASVAAVNRETQLSLERQQAMALRTMEVEHGFPVTYIAILDDQQPSKKPKQKELG